MQLRDQNDIVILLPMLLKIKQIKHETDEILSFIFDKPTGFSFYPGQYLDIKLPVGNTRAFTISSSPTEDFLMITPKKGISPFKKLMEQLKIGDEVESSHPAGTFTLDESSPAVFLAGGIGITPFRSILKYVFDQKLKTPITLIYSNSDDNFLFKKELKDWKQTLPEFTIIYHNSTQNGHLTKLPPTNYHLPIYYLAGSHSFVNDMEKILKQLGVDETNIRYDRFDGYI